jgi:bacterioferritin-associated ferredoxin
MTTHITKTWFDGEKVVTQEIPESEVYKQEPVAWEDVLGAIARGWAHPENARKPMDVQLAVAIAKEIQDMYTTPPAAQPCPTCEALARTVMMDQTAHDTQRQPLTKERIGQIIEQCKITLVNYCSDEKQIEFARAIEAAHGIGEKT